MAFANDICGLLEDAVQAYLRSLGLTQIDADKIYTGIDDEDLRLPRVVVVCNHASRIVQPDGDWDCDLEVFVRSNCDDTPRAAHRSRAGEVFAAFNIGPDNFADAVNAVTLADGGNGLNVFYILSMDTAWDRVGEGKARSWRSWTKFTVKCGGTAST